MGRRGIFGNNLFNIEKGNVVEVKLAVTNICKSLMREIGINDWETNFNLKTNLETVAEDLLTLSNLIMK